MQDKELISMFEAHLRDEKKASKNTLDSYIRDIRQLSDFLQQNTDHNLQSATEGDLEAYIDELRANGKSVATVSRFIASIKNFYMQMCIKRVIEKSPANNLKPDKPVEKIPEVLTNEEIDSLLKQPKCVDAKGYRDKAMLELMYATGMRVSELLDLDITDVNLDARIIRVNSKNKERFIPMYPEAIKALREYINLVRPQMLAYSDETALFVNVTGERMSRQGFWKIIKYYTKSAGINKDITPQTLRHSFATHLLENGADMQSIQELMGFSDISSAQVYSKVVKSSIKDVYKNYHPKA